MVEGWKGSKIRLVPLEMERHFENACRWVNDPVVTEHLLVGDFPMSTLAERKWFESVQEANRDDISFAIETLSGDHIGFSGIHQINWRHGYAITGTMIGNVQEWAKGYGTDQAIVRARYAFEVLGLRLLHSAALEGNERSLRMQLRVGYVVVGTSPKKYWKRGEYRDEILTALTRERFLELHG